jgi:hypothetical protein
VDVGHIKLLLATVAVFTVGLLLIGSTQLSAQGNCQPVSDAMSKVFATPSHIYGSMSPVSKDGSKPRTADITTLKRSTSANRRTQSGPETGNGARPLCNK